MSDKPDLSMCTFEELFEEMASRSDSIIVACALTADGSQDESPIRMRVAGNRVLGRGLLAEMTDFIRQMIRNEGKSE